MLLTRSAVYQKLWGKCSGPSSSNKYISMFLNIIIKATQRKISKWPSKQCDGVIFLLNCIQESRLKSYTTIVVKKGHSHMSYFFYLVNQTTILKLHECWQIF